MEEKDGKNVDLKPNEQQTEVKANGGKTKKKGKKVLLITIITLLILSLIGGGVFFAINYFEEKIEEMQEKQELEWGDAYLEILNDKDKIEDMDNLQIQLADLDLNNIPELIIYGIKNSKDYIATIYKINDEKKIDTIKVSLDKEFDLKYLYNLDKDNYKWYAVEKNENNSNNLNSSNISSNLSESSNTNKIYDIHIDDKKYEPELTELKIGEDCIEIEDNYSKKIDFDKNASKDEIKKAFEQAKEGFVAPDDMITEKVKNIVDNFKTVKKIKKADQSKELVYTVETFQNNDISMKYPAINLDSDDVKQINKEIEERFGFKVASGSSEDKYNSIMEQGFMETEVESYKYYVNGTILSLVPFSGGNDSIWAKTYNVDLKSLNKISGEDILKNNNLDKSEVLKRAKEEALKVLNQEMENDKKKMGSHYDEMFGGSNSKSKQIDEWKANLEKSIENLNVFQNKNGEVCLLAEYEHFGGQWTCTKTIIINISKDYSVSNFELEMLGTTKITETTWHFDDTNVKQETTTNTENKTEESNTLVTENEKTNTSNNSTETVSENTQSSSNTGKNVQEGKYNRGNTGTLEISNATGNSFDFDIECYYYGSNPDAPNIGMVSGTAKATSNGNYQYEKTDEYGYYELIKFNIDDSGKITIEDFNKDKSGRPTENPYCGFNVTLDGEYVK